MITNLNAENEFIFTKRGECVLGVVFSAGFIAGISTVVLCALASCPEQSTFHAPYSGIDVNCWHFNKTVTLAVIGSIVAVSTIVACAGSYFLRSKRIQREQAKIAPKIDREKALIVRAKTSQEAIGGAGGTFGIVIALVAITYLLTICFVKNYHFKCEFGNSYDNVSFENWQKSMEHNLYNPLGHWAIVCASGFGITGISYAIGYIRKKKILKSGTTHVKEPEEL